MDSLLKIQTQDENYVHWKEDLSLGFSNYFSIFTQILFFVGVLELKWRKLNDALDEFFVSQ